MYVCICKAVTEKQVRQAIDSGIGSLRGLREELNLGSQCGKCSRTAKTFLEEAPSLQSSK